MISDRNRLTFSIIVLIAANLLPVFGVLLWDWDVFVLLLPFFFMAHYGGFMFGHFMVLIGMYSGDADSMRNMDGPLEYLWAVIERVTWVPTVALFVSHGWSFITNFLGTDERKTLRPNAAMAMPYRRMIVTHVALIAGGFFLVSAGQPLAGLLILLGLKIALDVFFHRKEHTGRASTSTDI